MVASQNVGFFLRLGWIQSNFNVIWKNLETSGKLKSTSATRENSLLSSLLAARDGEEQRETAVFSSCFKKHFNTFLERVDLEVVLGSGTSGSCLPEKN